MLSRASNPIVFGTTLRDAIMRSHRVQNSSWGRQVMRRSLRFETLESRFVFDSSFDLQSQAYARPQTIDPHHDDGTLRFDQRGLAYHYDGVVLLDGSALNGAHVDQVWSNASRSSAEPLRLESPSSSGSSSAGSVGGGIGTASPPAGLIVPVYHSNPSFSKKIYLDFDGEMVSGTAWNNQNYGDNFNTGNTIHAPAFSTDADLTTFSASELAAIQEVWARVSEDYAPFQVDVTTEYPGAGIFTAGEQAIRVIISTETDATTGAKWFPPSGGVAYIGSWYWTDGSPVWAFSNNLGGGFPKYIAEAVSHEVGHAFGLGHDGRDPSEGYYQGHGSGATGWAPLMGVGYYKSLSQWSQGEYANANNQEDDLDIISQGVNLVIDDHGGNPATATQLIAGTGGAIAGTGIIATRSDKDAFRFGTQSGSITLNASPFDFSTGKANLDVEISLINSAGTTIATVNPVGAPNATLTLSVPKGFYTLVVDGVGKAAISGDEGYSDYGSIGMYAITGNVVPNRSPVAVTDNANAGFNSSVLVDVLSNDTDADSDLLAIQSIGAASIGTAVLEAGKIRYTPPIGYLGQATFSYTIRDELGATAIGQVAINVHTVIATRGAFYKGATGASASSGPASDKTPLLPGQSSSFANYTNYSLGLNGIVVDIAGLPAGTTGSQLLSSMRFAQWNGISAGGFAALPSAAIPNVTVLGFVGTGSSARVQITFPDNTLQNTWLRVTVLADNTTKLLTNDVFYFGNVIGDVNTGNTSTRLRVNATDTGAVRSNQSTADNSASILNIYDLNRDGRVNATDTGIVRSNQQTAGIVAPILAPGSLPAPSAPSGFVAAPPTVPPMTITGDRRKERQSTTGELVSSEYLLESSNNKRINFIPHQGPSPMPNQEPSNLRVLAGKGDSEMRPRKADLDILDQFFSSIRTSEWLPG